MRLLSKISYYHFWLSAVVLGITGCMLFLFLRKEISKEIEEQLELQTDMVAEEIHMGRTVAFPLVQITKGDESLMKLPKIFKDTLIYDRLQKVTEGYYYFVESKKINGQPYRIKVMTTYIGWDNYSKTIIYIFLSIAVLLVVLGTLVNYFISRRVWKPFLINLKRMKGYSVSSKEELQLTLTDVTEFKEMNNVLTDLAARGKREYTALKEFTENASHEIQTPLSILKTRLESISQQPLTEQIAHLLNDAKQATIRLSKVNKGLLLLAKLENNAYTDVQWVSLEDVLKRNFDLMEDLFQHKGLRAELQIQSKKVFASAFLMEILISNLLSNALSYAPKDAQIVVNLNEEALEITNEGKPLSFPESKLFSRFGKDSQGYKGNGLGLSIVKQICTLNKWNVKYNYEKHTHRFSIHF
ncbi:HAMP domain-containing sensor histidine kinase [Pedobacter sp. B4-66]|uniref:sensor histidine kinase n=1 Tax=Pedobacter sp. B4-66 TaxID=2817280 RepID=UPI001BD9B2E9|nr:HAMP domain-containing sensor histidine kinase [Pedobacter sp. B4-66]